MGHGRVGIWRFGWAALVLAAGPLSGQAVLRGRVGADSTRRPIVGASLVISGLPSPVFSNALGRYEVLGIPAGRHTLVVRAFGYAQLSTDLNVAAGDTLDAEFLLTPDVTVLAPLVTRAQPVTFIPGKLEDFERRRQIGFGKFFDRKVLAAIEPASLERVIRTTPGVRIVSACNRSLAMTMRQGHGQGEDNRNICLLNWFCPLAVYVDGALLWSPGMGELPPDMAPIMARQLEAVEVYRGPSETPIEYQATGSSCGVLLLWTRLSDR